MNDVMITTHHGREKIVFSTVLTVIQEFLDDPTLTPVQRSAAVEAGCFACGWPMQEFEAMYLANEDINVQRILSEEKEKLAHG